MTVLSHARIVLDGSIHEGAVAIEDGRIAAVTGAAPGEDMAGDYLIPGIVDLHTDNLERQAMPRANARWPARSAMLAHDAQCAAAGITTVFDALCVGDIGFDSTRNRTFEEGLAELVALGGAGVMKSEHFLHLRCELPGNNLRTSFARAAESGLVRLVSLMDHTPGMGQYADLPRYRAMRAAEGYSAAAIENEIALLKAAHRDNHARNRAFVLSEAAALGFPVASHDDRTAAEIRRNEADGIGIAEFPVSLEAARAARASGLRSIAGAPNIVRGGSHSGNVSVSELLRLDLLDALASDYVPAAMLEAAFCAVAAGIASLPRAVALITSGPADMVGLRDRGRIAPGLRADLVRVRLYEGVPVVRAVWRQGERIA